MHGTVCVCTCARVCVWGEWTREERFWKAWD